MHGSDNIADIRSATGIPALLFPGLRIGWGRAVRGGVGFGWVGGDLDVSGG